MSYVRARVQRNSLTYSISLSKSFGSFVFVWFLWLVNSHASFFMPFILNASAVSLFSLYLLCFHYCMHWCVSWDWKFCTRNPQSNFYFFVCVGLPNFCIEVSALLSLWRSDLNILYYSNLSWMQSFMSHFRIFLWKLNKCSALKKWIRIFQEGSSSFPISWNRGNLWLFCDLR